MSSRFLRLVVVVIVIAAGQAVGESADVRPHRPAADPFAAGAALQAAPGGGDMVILAPEARYVTRAWRDGTGQPRCGCAREHSEAADETHSRERR